MAIVFYPLSFLRPLTRLFLQLPVHMGKRSRFTKITQITQFAVFTLCTAVTRITIVPIVPIVPIISPIPTSQKEAQCLPTACRRIQSPRGGTTLRYESVQPIPSPRQAGSNQVQVGPSRSNVIRVRNADASSASLPASLCYGATRTSDMVWKWGRRQVRVMRSLTKFDQIWPNWTTFMRANESEAEACKDRAKFSREPCPTFKNRTHCTANATWN